MSNNQVSRAKRFHSSGLFENADLPALEQTMSEIHSLGLERNLLDLLVYGYTVLKSVLSEKCVQAARQIIQAHFESRFKRTIDLNNATSDDLEGVQPLNHILCIDGIFDSILLEPKPLALVTYLLGRSCKLSSISSLIKGPNGSAFKLHSDNGNGMTEPYPMIAQTATVNYALSPYTRDNGALALVPGSHHHCR